MAATLLVFPRISLAVAKPKAAAAVIVGYSITGPQTWKNKDGKTLKEIEEEQLKKQNSGI